MLVASVSCGNDSIALMQWLHEHEAIGHFDRVLCVYLDTGWASRDWMDRVAKAEHRAKEYGFEPHRATSIGFMPLARLKKAFPRNGMQFCTEELKIKPFTIFVDQIDPEREATVAVGVRREESQARAQWPEYIESSERHGGRDAWFPLVRATERERRAYQEGRIRAATPSLERVLPVRQLKSYRSSPSDRGQDRRDRCIRARDGDDEQGQAAHPFSAVQARRSGGYSGGGALGSQRSRQVYA